MTHILCIYFGKIKTEFRGTARSTEYAAGTDVDEKNCWIKLVIFFFAYEVFS